MSIANQDHQRQTHLRRQYAQKITSQGLSVTCADILASQVILSASGSQRQVATMRPRRLHSGYNVTTTAGRFTFDQQKHGRMFGTAVWHDGDIIEAVIRPVRAGVIAIDLVGASYIVYSSNNMFYAVDRIQGSSTSSADAIRVGVVRATEQTGRKTVRKASPFTFHFMEQVSPLLIPLLAIVIREEAAAAAMFTSTSTNKRGVPAVVLSAPVVAVTAAVGAAVC